MGARVYPVQSALNGPAGYRVLVNGREAELNRARVSACPYNRRWPGHQRTEDQTEIIEFLSMETDGPAEIEIEAPEAFERVCVRPLSLGIVPETEGKKIRFRLENPVYLTVEPYGRRNALHLFADGAAAYDIGEDESVLYFGPGEHDAGMIELKSGQTLLIDEGAVVYGCIRATDAENIRIIGRGILDNSRNRAKILYEVLAEGNDMAVNNAERLHTVQMEYCTNVEIDGITIRDSLVYNIRPVGCRNMTIRNVKIIGCWRYNSDGIDMHNCENVLIENCFLRTFDDSICVKGFDCYYEGDVEAAVNAAMYRNGEKYDVFRNVLVRRCVIWNDWGKALEIGAETRAEAISDIVFEDCDVIHVTGPVLDCMNVDYADVHDVVYRDIRVEYDDVIPRPAIQKKDGVKYEEIPADKEYAPPLMCVEVLYHPEYSAGGNRRGRNRRILFENISLTGRQAPGMVVKGIDEAFGCREITVRGLMWNGHPVRKLTEDQLHVGAGCSEIVIE
ncbi:MAG: right-handed parallel beta-helix repeat-containing protein [Clostridia bacterium]|nr:right-handed parallel beta-helix repeat-containing protein [Clostridia bacterium]